MLYVNLRHKGALFLEYALILAFVILTGVAFVGSEGLAGGVADIFGNTGKVVSKAAEGEKSVEQRNKDFVELLMAYLKEVGTTD